MQGPDECVQEMRAKVKEETNLTVSGGIASNKARRTASSAVLHRSQCFRPDAREGLHSFLPRPCDLFFQLTELVDMFGQGHAVSLVDIIMMLTRIP